MGFDLRPDQAAAMASITIDTDGSLNEFADAIREMMGALEILGQKKPTLLPSEILHPALEIINRLIDIFELSLRVRSINSDDGLASGASHLRLYVPREFAEGFRKFSAATRAGKIDLGILDHLEVSTTNSLENATVSRLAAGVERRRGTAPIGGSHGL